MSRATSTARGLSTMPHFTGGLSVAELIDLVAYLGSLSDAPASAAAAASR